MQKELLHVPQGDFELHRFPYNKKEKLRAWDAADEYLLNHFNENHKAENPQHILVINDSFGALSVSLSVNNNVTLWSDSFLAEQGVLKNFKLNRIAQDGYSFVNSIGKLNGHFDVVVMKVPKSHALLEDQLIRLLPLLHDDTIFLSAAMVKNIHTSTLKLFEKIIGDTKTSLAVKKARLIFSEAEASQKNLISPYPKCYQLEGSPYKICNHANVFSREKLDIGTRFFLEHISASDDYESIVDMGCGNGLVGLISAEKNPQAKVIFTDESYMAIESAALNMKASGLINETEFYAMDCLQKLENDSVDLVLNNPPFHQQHATGDAVAWRMFNDAKRVLKKGGEFLVIGNRHLDYHVKLKKLFGNCEMVASNKKFVILKSSN